MEINSSRPSSLVTDAYSLLSGDPRLGRSASFNESYKRLPASPLSFNSNNVSACSVMDGSAAAQQSPHYDLVKKQGATSAASQFLEQDSSYVLNAVKKPKLGMRQEDIMQQHVMQQILQRQDSMQSQAHQNARLQSMLQQHRPPLCQPPVQQIVQSFSHMQRAPAPTTFQHQQQLRHNLQQLPIQNVTPVKRPFDNGVCSRRLMQYLYHQRHRPNDNTISYWSKFVAEYFAPQAKERWCLSMYDNIGKHALGSFFTASCGCMAVRYLWYKVWKRI